MGKVFTKILGVLLISIGIGLYIYPDIQEWVLDWRTKQYIKAFEEEYSIEKNEDTAVDYNMDKVQEDFYIENQFGEDDADRLKRLYQEILEYNRDIYENGQIDFKDAWSYVQSPVTLTGLEDGRFGYIHIPSMDVTLPLYIGASDTNMAKGAAIMGQTSIAVGGENTNSVIAGHRGWSTGSFFRDIEEVSVNDYIYITNPWQTLVYRVESIDIIKPDNSDAVKIQAGKDMITIVTCHPYLSQGKYRYLLYCIRDKDAENARIWEDESRTVNEEKDPNNDGVHVLERGEYILASDGNVYESSENTIHTEKLLRRGSSFAIMLIVLTVLLYVRTGLKTDNRH